jgi:hypothetical protein
MTEPAPDAKWRVGLVIGVAIALAISAGIAVLLWKVLMR